MASESRASGSGVGSALAHAPQEFRFFQAVRLLRLFARSQDAPYRGRSIQFRTHLALDFPASEIYDLVLPEESPGDSAEADHDDAIAAADTPALSMFVTFMGLTGNAGVLPHHYTELLLQRQATLQRQGVKDDSAHAFFDLFSHRLIELFYEAWRKYRFYVHYESGEQGHLPQHLLELVGIGTPSLQGRLNRDGKGVPDSMLAYYAGALSNGKRCAQTLSSIIEDYFGIKTRIAQLRARWLAIPRRDQSQLAAQCATLGEDAVLGDKTWDTQTLCRVELGPLPIARYRSFLPDGEGHAALCRFVRLYLGWAIDVEIQVKLAGERPVDETRNPRGKPRAGWADVPMPRLGDIEDGVKLPSENGVKLGWMGWLGGRINGASADDCVLSVEREEI